MAMGAMIEREHDKAILTLNSGSSSVKYAAFSAGGETEIGAGSLDADETHGTLFERCDALIDGRTPYVIGHRVVHGGVDLFDPVRIEPGTRARLEEATRFAPLHGHATLALIDAAGARYPGVPQIACFDTGFHADLPDIARVLPIPSALRETGLRRYGFHGLSCRSILRQLGPDHPGRIIIAHLGSGASVTAVRDGRSIDTSMGLTPSGGVVMATRMGDVDPGLLLHIMRDQQLDAASLENLVDRQAGLLGISGLSGDLRALHASTEKNAALAIRIFCRSVAKQVAAMAIALGGADLLVFTGGIGEHDAQVRDAIIAECRAAGLRLDSTAALTSQENAEIALGAWAVVAGGAYV
jgi:acetate kinase